ncbi:MAG: lipoyl(octanoyl) transferase LipB [Candidatus Bipolaricaulota bacterium]|nr:lipoyl(octanoyl) transferase LipB [Candidatus Bipolaricaulota bacterium]
MNVLDLGVRDYVKVWELQKELVAQRQAGQIPDTLIVVEHPPVFTIGRGGRPSSPSSLLPSPSPGRGAGGEGEERVRTSRVRAFLVERGGDITFHGPGQLVGYPIVDLRDRGRDVHRFLRDLEEVLISTLRDFSLLAQRRPGLTGVWVGTKKIASIGIAVRRWVSYHGFALNVSVDLSYFRMIRPCGLDGDVITTMSELLGRAVSVAEVKPYLLRHWAEVFCCQDHAPSVAPITLQY